MYLTKFVFILTLTIKERKLLNRNVLSSGTIEGTDVAIFLASKICNKNISL